MYASLAKALAASTYRQTGYRLDTDVGLMCSIALCGGDVWGGGGVGVSGVGGGGARRLYAPLAKARAAST